MAIVRVDEVVQTAQGQAIQGADVYFLTQPANIGNLTPLATVYSNVSGAPGSNPQITDGLGQIGCYISDSQLYTVVVVSPLIQTASYPDQAYGGGGSGGSTGFQQTPAGTINGINTTFTLTVTPTVLNLALNGVILTPGIGYTTAVVSGTFTITTASAPQSGDVLYATGLI